MKPTINIGCGNDSWGDVRIDVQQTKSANLIMNFDSCERLPFSDKEFSQCRLFQVLEHSRNPQHLLSEAIRISDVVLAKFPYKYDRVPFVLSMLTSFQPWQIKDAIIHSTLHFLSQIKLMDSPMKHRWLIQPFGKSHINKIRIPQILDHGRKAKFTRRCCILLPMEWECRVE